MLQLPNKLCRQSTEGNRRLREMLVCEGVEIEFTSAGIWLLDAKGSMNLKQLKDDMEHDGIAAEVRNFYCG